MTTTTKTRPCDSAEQMRRLALGLLAALVVARAYWPSEPDRRRRGDRPGLDRRSLPGRRDGRLLPSLITGRFAFRWAPTDAAVIASDRARRPQRRRGVDWRIAINLAWEWVAIGTGLSPVAQSAAVARRVERAGAGFRGHGRGRLGVRAVPGRRRAARASGRLPAQSRRRSSRRWGSSRALGSQQAFEQRLIGSNEVYSTFALANSLAGFLVGPLVLVLGMALQNLARPGDRGSRWSVLAMACAPALLDPRLPGPDQEPKRLDRPGSSRP